MTIGPAGPGAQEPAPASVAPPASAPPELWERALAGWRGWLGRHERFARGLFRVSRFSQRAALVLLLVVLAVVPRVGVAMVPAVFMTACTGLLALAARTRTIKWRSIALMLSLAVPWAGLVALFTRAVGASVGMSDADDGMSIAMAAFIEEPGKLLPLLVVAVVAPGRVRRVAAVDWALLGMAAGAGFTIAEDGARRLPSPGLLASLLGERRLSYSLNPFTSGAFSIPDSGLIGMLTGDDRGGSTMVVGHQVSTMLVASAIAIGIALWRNPAAAGAPQYAQALAGRPPTGRLVARRVLAWIPGLLAGLIVITDHAAYNATVSSFSWLESGEGIPDWMILAWAAAGRGHAQPWLAAIAFLVCLLIDAHHRGATALAMGAATPTPTPTPTKPAAPTAAQMDPIPAPSAYAAPPPTPPQPAAAAVGAGSGIGAGVSGPLPVGNFSSAPGSGPRAPGSGAPKWLRSLVGLMRALAASTRADFTEIVGAYTQPGMDRAARMVAGRQAQASVMQARALTQARAVAGSEPACRGRFRLIALAIGVAATAACLFYGVSMARSIGVSVTVDGDQVFFAGLLDALAYWWDQLSLGQQIAVTAYIAMLALAACASVGLALAIAGAVTWAFAHGHGLASYLRDPNTAVAEYLKNATPGQLLLDTLDFALTFIPGSTIGLGARKAVSTAATRQATRHATKQAARREAAEQAGRSAARTWTKQQVTDWINGLHTVTRKPHSAGIQYQHRVLGTDIERVIPTGVGDEKIVADAVTNEGNAAMAWETKYSGGGASAVNEGTAPPFIQKKADADFIYELQRYRLAILNTTNPIQGLTIVTNTEAAASHLGRLAHSVLGEGLQLTIKVIP
ncbi:hypothetical protein [Actinomyces procaprae]|uniref:hypothetical protein n=1 Tax=Actinomyces procaprae TaxID=2560010 RepID=UPI001444D71D|nr:hypothetical protein [Actinomyces procaprae]